MNEDLPKPKRLRKWLSNLTVFLLVCATWFIWQRPDLWQFRHQLPWGAQDVHEWYQEDSFLPDYSYLLKAKITEDQFRSYIGKFGLTIHSENRKYSEPSDPWLNWTDWSGRKNDWWNPSSSIENTFVAEGGDTWTFAKYEQGYLYLSSVNH